MSNLRITFPDGATPIDLDEIKELIPDYISTMGELNQLEQANIVDAFVWSEKQSLEDLLTVSFSLELHKKMFDQVWKWAGKMRRSNKNIGVFKEQIMNDLGQLLKDTNYWIEHGTYEQDKIAARFHHRLVQIHVFANGNGRHARLMTDLLLKRCGKEKFSWGMRKTTSPIEVEEKTRLDYIAALQAADRGDFEPLIIFARG